MKKMSYKECCFKGGGIMTQKATGTHFLYMYGVIIAKELQMSELPSIMGIDQHNHYYANS